LENKMAETRATAASRRPVAPKSMSMPVVAMTPREVLGILRRHLVLIVILTILGVVAGGLGCAGLRKYFPLYTAKAYIEVLAPGQTDPMRIETPMVGTDIRYGHRVSVANQLRQQSAFQDLLKRDVVKGTKWFTVDMHEDVSEAVKYLEDYMSVVPHRDADYVEVAMTARRKDEAAAIVNEMVSMFVASRTVVSQDQIARKLQELDKQKDEVELQLQQAEAALDDVRKTYNLTDIEERAGRYFKHTITLKLDQLELEKNDLDLMIEQLKADIENFKELAEGPITVQVQDAIENDPVMVVLAQQLAFTEARYASLLTRFGENHRDVRQLQELKDEILSRREVRAGVIAEQRRRANLENAIDRLVTFERRRDALLKLIEEARTQKRDLDMARVEYERRDIIRKERVAMLDDIKAQIEKLRIIHDDPETPKVRALGAALEPLEMVLSRQWYVWFPSGTILGFLLGLGLAFLLDLTDDRVRMPRDVGRYLEIPLLGVIPDATADSQARGVELARVLSQAPYSMISEAYRQCRANLKLSGSGESLKTFVVTSASPGDGKTSVAVNLATAFVAEEKKVLLIDANFRQPRLEKLFPKGGSGGVGDAEGLSVSFGLSSLLVGQCSTAEAIRSSGIEGLDIIDAGLVPPNPAELLGSVRMEELLKEQRARYDYIIIDSPPVLLISDAKVLARIADATILVFNAAETRRGTAQRTIREVRDVEGNVVGCVLLGAPLLKGGYFQEQFKSFKRYQQAVQVAGGTA